MNLSKLLDYVKDIDLTKADGESLELTEEADNTIHQLLEVEAFVAEAKEKLKERFLVIAQKNPKLKSYEGDYVKVGYTMTRRKAINGEPAKQFYIFEKKPNTKAIDAYRESMGKLPAGIEEKAFEYISFKQVKKDSDACT
jgi:hypothetical protein